MPVIQRTNLQPQPRNRGSVGIARSSIDNIMPMAIEQSHNALLVDGRPILYYRRKTSGVVCSCCAQDTPTVALDDLKPGVSVLNPDGFGSREFLSEMLTGSIVRIDRYTTRNHDRRNFEPNQTEARADNHSRDEIRKSTNRDDGVADDIVPFDVDDVSDMDSMSSMLDGSMGQTSSNSCAVCLGTGIRGGYDLANGQRDVYTEPVEVYGAQIDPLARPTLYTVEEGGSLVFKISTPFGGALDVLRVWGNREAQNVSVEMYDQSWMPYSPLGFQSMYGGDRYLRITFPKGGIFTHLEVQHDLHMRPLVAEWSKQTESFNQALAENLEPVNMVLTPYLTNVHINDIVADTSYERLWLITNRTDFQDRERNPHGWEATARLVQRFELASQLFIKRIPHRAVQTTRTYQKVSELDSRYTPLSYNKQTPLR